MSTHWMLCVGLRKKFCACCNYDPIHLVMPPSEGSACHFLVFWLHQLEKRAPFCHSPWICEYSRPTLQCRMCFTWNLCALVFCAFEWLRCAFFILCDSLIVLCILEPQWHLLSICIETLFNQNHPWYWTKALLIVMLILLLWTLFHQWSNARQLSFLSAK